MKIIGLKRDEKVVAEFGDYLPFKFDLTDGESCNCVYWRLGNFKSSLIEIGVDRKSGVVASFSLVIFDCFERGVPELSTSLRAEVGVPCFSVDCWHEEMLLDERAEVRVFYDSNKIMIAWADVDTTEWIVVSDCVEFGIGFSGRLCWVFVRGLPEESISGLSLLQSTK
ncbi:hypothetical protein [Chromobacterium sp.]|uniref:hypothetical protein n=1 Tax=Chromobacterium sp. TaxID=306190 RepID=UPI0035AD8787